VFLSELFIQLEGQVGAMTLNSNSAWQVSSVSGFLHCGHTNACSIVTFNKHLAPHAFLPSSLRFSSYPVFVSTGFREKWPPEILCCCLDVFENARVTSPC